MTTPAPLARIAYLDFLKGVACLVMLVAHAMHAHIGHPDLVARIMLILQPPAAQLFFFVSGMNVVLAIERHEKRPGFDLDAYYLGGAALLFAIGFVYSFARMSLDTWQIFQGLAAATAMTFVLLRMRLPNWALVLAAVALYAAYLPFRLGLEPVLMWYRHTLPVGVAPDHPSAILAAKTILGSLPLGTRWLFANFGLLPWTSYTLLGAAAFRSVRARPERARWWAVGFALTLAAGIAAPWVPHGIERGLIYADTITDALFRHVPYHALTATGLVGLAFLACHRWYGTPSGRAAKYLEFLGVQSFVFFCFHWLGLKAMLGAWDAAAAPGWVGAVMPIHLRWLLALAIVLPLMVPVARLGVVWGSRPRGLRQQLVALVLGIALSLMLWSVPAPKIAGLAAFVACVVAAYAYPGLRARWKQHLLRRAPAA